MSLGDFFTLTEIKDGLSSLRRVEELVSAMQNQKGCVLNIVSDASRHWSTVVGTLAATENKDCLNHFVQLDGLCFLNQWLQECQKCNKDGSDDLLDGLITSLLAMLEKLPLDREKLVLSGIWINIKHLIGHKNLNIKERAKYLSDKWSDMRFDDNNGQLLENQTTSLNEQAKPLADINTTKEVSPTDPVVSGSPGKGGATSEIESTCAESKHSNVTRYSGSSQLNTNKFEKISGSEQLMPTNSSSNSAGINAGLGELKSLDSSLISTSFPENLSVTGESSLCPAVGLTSAGTHCSPVCREEDEYPKGRSVYREVSDGTKAMEMEVDTNEGSPRICRAESCSESSSSGLSASSPSSSVENLKGSEGGDFVFPSVSSRAEAFVQMDQKSGPGFEYEEIDALEMACQVALEVEREVVDYREPFCSSPEVNSVETTGTHSCPVRQNQSLIDDLDSNMFVVEKDPSDYASSPKDHKFLVLQNTVPVPQEHEQPLESPKVSSVAPGSALKFDKNILDFDLNENICTEEFDCSQNPLPSIPAVFSEEPSPARGWGFDALPQPNMPAILSAPKALFAASRGAPSFLPVTPLQFGGEMGWKGSAATSAFRPAPPRSTPDCIKTCSDQKQKRYLEIDLNVAGSEDDVIVDQISAKQVPGLPSGDSSVEESSRIAKKLKLNHNSLGNVDISSANPYTHWRVHLQNGGHSMSSASSSSLRQPALIDFDLNDNPSFLDAGGSLNPDNSSSKASTTTCGSSRLDDAVITIMGSRLAVERKDHLNQARQSFLSNGLNTEAMVTARPPFPYAYMPTPYGYNGNPMGHGSIMPVPPFYGHGAVSFMVDSKGGTAMPQVLGSACLNGAHYMTPFLTSLNGAATSTNGLWPSRTGLDLNSSLIPVEGSSSDVGSFKQPFMQNHNGLMDESLKQTFIYSHNGVKEEQLRISSQQTSSAMPLKIKESDCGWEPSALGYTQDALKRSEDNVASQIDPRDEWANSVWVNKDK